jgi:phenylacetate-CoA ligase
MAYCMTMAGVKPGMVVHNAYGYGLFTGGLGFHQGAERIGALTIPVSGGVTARQAILLRDLGGQVLCSTPSYALHIAQGLREAGIGADELALEIGMFGAEPWTEGMRAQLEAELGLVALNIYGLSEIVGPGVACECPAKDGLHVMEDHFLVEVVHPESGAPVPDGTDGELVFTTLTKEAMPLLRYRTGDIASLNREPCVCGRAFARMSAVRGRRDDMLIIRGVNLYPSQIEHALLSVDGIAPHYQLVVERPEQLDELTVLCEGDGADLAERVRAAIREQVGVSVRVDLRPPGAIPRSEGKAVRVIDKRT